MTKIVDNNSGKTDLHKGVDAIAVKSRIRHLVIPEQLYPNDFQGFIFLTKPEQTLSFLPGPVAQPPAESYRPSKRFVQPRYFYVNVLVSAD